MSTASQSVGRSHGGAGAAAVVDEAVWGDSAAGAFGIRVTSAAANPAEQTTSGSSVSPVSDVMTSAVHPGGLRGGVAGPAAPGAGADMPPPAVANASIATEGRFRGPPTVRPYRRRHYRRPAPHSGTSRPMSA